MNIAIPQTGHDNIIKKLFKLKPPKRNGLILTIHHSSIRNSVRFFHCCFHKCGKIAALADNNGHVYFVDFIHCKYWGLQKLDSCTFLKFSELNENELLIGKSQGVIEIINIDSGCMKAKLLGHNFPIFTVSFANKYLCLSASHNEAIVWDLRINTKLQVLKLEQNCNLKFISFIPVCHHILACFQDDIIQIWRNKTYENLKQFLPSNWNNDPVKCIAFSKNGKIMVVSSYVPKVAVFLLDDWQLIKFISLPGYIHTIKKLEFIPQRFDGGNNKYLALLSGQGCVHIFNIEDNIIISEIQSKNEISKFCISPSENSIVCLLSSGEAEIYDLTQYLMESKEVPVGDRKQKKIKLRTCSENKMEVIKDQISEILDTGKLKSVLVEYGEFPESFRTKIWGKLLQIPNNVQQYNTLINHVTVVAFDDLYSRFPLENETNIKNLKKLLNNIVTWCPFFATVEYLPLFCFPFIKVFECTPIACFEVVCTVIINWCQHWFEYYPLPPVNILAMVENIMMEHDPDLLHFFSSKHVTSNIYAWLLLETAFSEVFTAGKWLQFWDHVLINEPSFLLCAVVAYNILNRSVIMSLETPEEFEYFYHNQKQGHIKRLLHKIYYILNNTSDKLHPRQYLEHFMPIHIGQYPHFLKYPQATVEFQMEKIKEFNDQWRELKNHEVLLQKEKLNEIGILKEIEIEKEEHERAAKVEAACMEKLKSYEDHVKVQHEKLKNMRQQLVAEQKETIEKSLKTLKEHKLRKNKNSIELLLEKLKIQDVGAEHDMFKLEGELMQKYLGLLKHKYKIEELFMDPSNKSNLDDEYKRVEKYKQELKEEMEKVRRSASSAADIKKLNLAASITLIQDLIGKIEMEITKESGDVPTQHSEMNMRLSAIEAETRELERDISKLLMLVSQYGNQERRNLPAEDESSG